MLRCHVKPQGVQAQFFERERTLLLNCKSNPMYDLQAEIIFAGKGGIKVNKLVHNIEGILAGRNLLSDIPNILTYLIFFPHLPSGPNNQILIRLHKRLQQHPVLYMQ